MNILCVLRATMTSVGLTLAKFLGVVHKSPSVSTQYGSGGLVLNVNEDPVEVVLVVGIVQFGRLPVPVLGMAGNEYGGALMDIVNLYN